MGFKHRKRRVERLAGTTGTEGERIEDLYPDAPVGTEFWHRSFSLWEQLIKAGNGFYKVNLLHKTKVFYETCYWLDNPAYQYGWRILESDADNNVHGARDADSEREPESVSDFNQGSPLD